MDSETRKRSVLGRLLEDESFIRGLSEAEVARRAGMKRQQLSRYKYSPRMPHQRQVARIAEVFGMDEAAFEALLEAYRGRYGNG